MVDDVSLGRANEEAVHENEVFPCTAPEAVMQRLINHGTFKHIHCRDNEGV